MDDELFADWSQTGMEIVRALQPVLFQHGAGINPVRVEKQVRITLPDVDRPIIQINDVYTKRAVKLKLTVGEQSGLGRV